MPERKPSAGGPAAPAQLGVTVGALVAETWALCGGAEEHDAKHPHATLVYRSAFLLLPFSDAHHSVPFWLGRALEHLHVHTAAWTD